MVIQENVYLYVCCPDGPHSAIYVHTVDLFTFYDSSPDPEEGSIKQILNFTKSGAPGYFELAGDDSEWEPFDPTWRNDNHFIWCRERDDERAKKLFAKSHEFCENSLRSSIDVFTKNADKEKRLAQKVYDSKIVSVGQDSPSQ